MFLSDKAIQEFKDIVKKEKGVELSDAEARDQGERLVSFFEILMEVSQVELRRKKRLEKEPEGFHLNEGEGPYNCRVCYESVSGKGVWWDLNGIKCLDCQRNINESIIPAEICDNDKLWIKDWQFQSDYDIHPSTRRKLIRTGLLHGRDLKRDNGSIYYTVYLVNENLEFLKKYPKKRKENVEFIAVGKNKVQL